MVALTAGFVLSSCTGNDINPNLNQNNFEVSSNITENTTWKTGNVYILASRVSVVSGVTLTIEPGVIIKGQAGTGANATALLIAQGAKIMAEGTATEPIIFTSIADNIEPGQIASPNMDPDLNGLWGGLIICGKAPISVAGDAEKNQIEGIPASDPNGLYGGTDATDNSGVLKYISIRHGGANIGEGNEINGLTLGGVGSGTVVENIEIVSNQDDGIEFFGGNVQLKNVISWNVGDDGLDTDQAFNGGVDNFLIINPGDECLELDGGEGSKNAEHTFTNGSVKAAGADGLVDLDNVGAGDPANTWVKMENIYFFDISEGQDFDDNPAELTLSNIQATIPSGALADYFTKGTDAFVTEVALKANTVGADMSAFTSGWSWAYEAGALADFK